MTEFTKLKIGFALALLGTLFALHPILDRFPDAGFVYLGYRLKVLYAYALTSALLSFCVYLYAVTLLHDHPHSWCERVGNATYALAILVLPVFGGLYLSAALAERVALTHVAWAAPAVAVGLGSSWIILSQVIAWRINRRLGDQDRFSKIEQLARQEKQAINHANEMFAGEHFDLSIVEAWRALEARLRQTLLNQRVATRAEDPQSVIRVAIRKGILKEPAISLVNELKRNWMIAVSVDPLPREAATESLGAVRYLLSTLPVKRARPASASSSSPIPASARQSAPA